MEQPEFKPEHPELDPELDLTEARVLDIQESNGAAEKPAPVSPEQQGKDFRFQLEKGLELGNLPPDVSKEDQLLAFSNYLISMGADPNKLLKLDLRAGDLDPDFRAYQKLDMNNEDDQETLRALVEKYK